MKNTATFSIQLEVKPDGPLFGILKGHADFVCEAAIYLEYSVKVSFKQQLKLVSAADPRY